MKNENKITLSDIKKALKDSRFRLTLPKEIAPEIEKFLDNPGCACHAPLYRKIANDCRVQLQKYYPNLEIPDEEKELKPVGESAEEETEEGSNVGAETAEEEVEEAEGKKPLDKSGEVTKCLECGCNQPANSHGATQLPNGDNVSTAVMVSPNETAKSTETIIPETTIERLPSVTDEDVFEDSEEDSEKSALSDEVINDIIAKAVKSATDSVTNEINSYKEEISKLQDDLATAKTKAVGSGPKRFAIKEKTVEEISHFLSIAADYRAKSASATDKELARGYKELAQDFEAKAKAIKAK